MEADGAISELDSVVPEATLTLTGMKSDEVVEVDRALTESEGALSDVAGVEALSVTNDDMLVEVHEDSACARATGTPSDAEVTSGVGTGDGSFEEIEIVPDQLLVSVHIELSLLIAVSWPVSDGEGSSKDAVSTVAAIKESV